MIQVAGTALSGTHFNKAPLAAAVEYPLLLLQAAERFRLSARAYHRVLKVARTLADLDGVETLGRIHLAEAISYRIASERLAAAA